MSEADYREILDPRQEKIGKVRDWRKSSPSPLSSRYGMVGDRRSRFFAGQGLVSVGRIVIRRGRYRWKMPDHDPAYIWIRGWPTFHGFHYPPPVLQGDCGGAVETPAKLGFSGGSWSWGEFYKWFS